MYVGTYGSGVEAFDATTGAAVLWAFPTPFPVTSSPAVAGGMVHEGSWDGTIRAFALPAQPSLSAPTTTTGHGALRTT